MHIRIAIATLAAAAAGVFVLAVPAHAATFTGDFCAQVDWEVVNGTTVSYTLTEDCTVVDDTVVDGSPTIN